MGPTIFVVAPVRRRWWAVALAAALAGAVIVASRGAPSAERAVPRPMAMAPCRATPPPVAAPAPDDCRPALDAWSAGRAALAVRDVDGRFRAERERAIDACLAPRR